jgi:hypothetical protein
VKRNSYRLEAIDAGLPLEIDHALDAGASLPASAIRQWTDAAGNTFLLVTIPDAAGKDAPFPSDRWAGCGTSIAYPIACSDVAVYKVSPAEI